MIPNPVITLVDYGKVGVGSSRINGQYLLLEDHYIKNRLLPAGTKVTEGLEVPFMWVPTPNVDPLNTTAVQMFYAAGPQDQGIVRTQFQPFPVPQPVTYWTQITPNLYALTGLGSNHTLYPPIPFQLGHPMGN